MRSWAFALGFAEAEEIGGIDEELLYVAALLHDLGLAPEFDAVRVPFESASGHVGWVLAAGAGWTPQRRDRVVEVVERHMLPSVDAAEDPEGHLLEIATGLDVSGSRPEALPEPFLREVLAAHPRWSLTAEFGACLVDQGARKPGSQAARLVAGRLENRLAADPLEALA